MQDRPTELELVEAVAQFLEDEVIPVTVDSRLRFRLLIAINVLKIVERELEAGEAPLKLEWRQLVSLLGRPAQEPPLSVAALRLALQQLNQELCSRIRAGEAEGSWGKAVFDHVYQAGIEKLRITNPHYLPESHKE
jgi:hypothetical protein